VKKSAHQSWAASFLVGTISREPSPGSFGLKPRRCVGTQYSVSMAGSSLMDSTRMRYDLGEVGGIPHGSNNRGGLGRNCGWYKICKGRRRQSMFPVPCYLLNSVLRRLGLRISSSLLGDEQILTGTSCVSQYSPPRFSSWHHFSASCCPP
jgi:hypothetical protein